jgi:RNA polymerase sigma factor for flagellar operon FliA
MPATPASRASRLTTTTGPSARRAAAAPASAEAQAEAQAASAEQWARLKAGTEAERLAARDALLTEHLGLVHHVSRQMSRTLSVKADFDELVSAGTMGLMAALEAFDASRGLAFSTFAAPRIRGSILDELRRQDHVPRSVRRKSREILAARETLMRVLGRAPDDKEVAEHLGVDLPTLWRWRNDIEGAHQVPLDRTPGERERDAAPTPGEVLAHEEQAGGVEDAINREQEVGILRDAIQRLKEQERVVLSLYYFEELKLHEIATVLSLTESRVSQIRSKALGKLRGELGPLRTGGPMGPPVEQAGARRARVA